MSFFSKFFSEESEGEIKLPFTSCNRQSLRVNVFRRLYPGSMSCHLSRFDQEVAILIFECYVRTATEKCSSEDVFDYAYGVNRITCYSRCRLCFRDIFLTLAVSDSSVFGEFSISSNPVPVCRFEVPYLMAI